MARRTGSLLVTRQATPWAGNAGANVIDLEDASGGALVIGDGLPTTFDASRYIQSSIFNRLNNLFWDTLIDLGSIGIFEWHADQPFREHARTIGSDGVIYRAVQDNTGQDPTTDSSNTYWIADTTATATNSEVEAGSDSNKAVTPSGLLSLFDGSPDSRWRGTESEFGLVRLATSTEVDAGTSGDRVVTPAGLRRNLLAPLASPVLTGTPEAPTASSGDNSDQIANTEYVQGEIAGLATETYVDNEVAGVGVSYVHLATAPSASSSTAVWNFGSLESDASTYVAFQAGSTTLINVLSTAPRGFIGFMVEFYQSSSFLGRGTVLFSVGGDASGVSSHSRVRLNVSGTTRVAQITLEDETPGTQNRTGDELAIKWSAGSSTGYEARVYAIVI